MIEAAQAKPEFRVSNDAAEKELKLRDMMRGMRRVLVAYSGGVDSTYLAAIATEELGSEALCITGLSPSVSEHQRNQAAEIANKVAFNLQTIETNELYDPNYKANDANRCFFCKDELYTVLSAESQNLGTSFIVDGTNADDLLEHRPGREAAKQHGVRSPLADVGLSKAEIRELSRRMGLPTWDLPASPCLSSRIATGVPVTIERLGRVERGEMFLRDLGFSEFRVRLHDDIARIEIAKDEMHRMFEMEVIDSVTEEFSKIGFRYVTLDLQGFRSGSMNPIT